MFRALCIALLAALVAGCATSPRLIELQDFDQKNVTVQKAVDPIAFAGFPTSEKWKQYFRSGQVFGAVVEFPQGLGNEGLENEFDSLLLFYDGLAVRQDGREFPARVLFIGNRGCKLSMLFIVGGTNTPVGLKGVIASTLSERMYRLRKERQTSARITEFNSENRSSEYRRSFVQRYGTALDTGFEFVSINDLRVLFADWREVKGADYIGSILIPPWMNYDAANSVATFNPRYTYTEKFAGTANLTFLPLSPVIGTLGGLVMDGIKAVNVPTRGRDADSIPGERAEASQFHLNELKSQCSPQTQTMRR